MSIITLEGNIGAGKTTLATALYEEFKRAGWKTAHIKEPIGPWTDFHGTNLLELLYKDIERWAFTFQVNALVDMTDYDRQAIQFARDGFVVIKERSSFSVRHIFSEHLYGNMTEAEYHIMVKLIDAIRDPREEAAVAGKSTPTDITLYVRTEPETCYKRVHKRGRLEETGREEHELNLDYLMRLHEQHERVAQKFYGRTIVVDNTLSKVTDPKSIMFGDTSLFDILVGQIRRKNESEIRKPSIIEA